MSLQGNFNCRLTYFMKNTEELSETLKKRVLEHSEKAFEKLEKEEQKKKRTKP